MSLILPALPYFVASAICFLLVTRAPGSGREKRAWKGICAAIALLGPVRPYEVHAQLSGLLRNSAMTGGWYAERAHHQLDLLLGGGFVAVVVAGFLLFETRRWHASTRLALLAILYLSGVFVLNVLSLHGVDVVLNRRMFFIPLRWIVDLPALALTAALALSFRRHAHAVRSRSQ